jgi:hypothetical protein
VCRERKKRAARNGFQLITFVMKLDAFQTAHYNQLANFVPPVFNAKTTDGVLP